MRTRDDIFTQVLVRNNRTTTDSFITDTNLKAWWKDATTWANSYHKWPFLEVRDQSTSFSVEEIPYSNFSVKFKSDSIRFLQIGGKRVDKVNFTDYQILREETPEATRRVFSDWGRVVYVNPNIDLSGTVTAWGQYQPTIDVTDETATTLFTDYDEEGNEAIVEKMQSYLKRREHLPDEAELHDQRAVAKLEEIWKRVQDEQHVYQTTPERGGMYKRIDVVNGGLNDELFHRDRFE